MAGQLTSFAGFGMGFYEQTVLIDRMLQKNIQRIADEMDVIDHIDQFFLVDRLGSLEGSEQINMLKKYWRSELVCLVVILIGFNIHVNAFPVTLNLFQFML